MTVRILRGDVRAMLATLPDRSFHCCVTSPPYWGLRSYLPPDHPEKHLEIGSERTVEEWVETIVHVFRGVRRVLRDDGTCWVNFGDSYAGSRQGPQGEGSTLAGNGHQGGGPKRHAVQRQRVAHAGLKPKDLVGQPWRAAFALQSDGCADLRAVQTLERVRSELIEAYAGAVVPDRVLGVLERLGREYAQAKGTSWWLRQDIIWGKRSPMPESARDRFTKAHEYVFLLTKSEHYYFDWQAIQEEASQTTHQRRASTGVGFGHGYDQDAKPRVRVAEPQGVGRRQGPPGNPAEKPIGRIPAGWATGTDRQHHETAGNYTRQRRSTSPKAVERDADNSASYVDGKSDRLGRGAGWRVKQNDSFDAAMRDMRASRNPRSVRVHDEPEYLQFLRWKDEQAIAPSFRMLSSEPFRGAHYATYPTALIEPFIKAGCPPGGDVLDPFGGSGTTGVEADRQGKNAVLIDLDERNVPMAERRLATDAGSVARQRRLFDRAEAA